MTQTRLKERRRYVRKPVVIRVDYRTVDEIFSDFTENIHEGGMFLQTAKPPKLGARVQMEFMLPGSDEPVHVSGTVTWIRGTDAAKGDPPGIGIQFDDLDPAARAQINSVVMRLRLA
jgi:uncharacterized protein (TIGR02266 family)